MEMKRARLHHQEETKRRQSGFSLLEMMIAMSLIAVGMLSIAAMLLQAMSSGRSSNQIGTALSIIQMTAEQAQGIPWVTSAPNNPPSWSTPGWLVVARSRCVQGGAINNPPLNCPAGTIPMIQEIPDGGGGLIPVVDEIYTVTWRVTDDPAKAGMRRIDNKVQWNDETRQAREIVRSIEKFNWDGP